MTKGTKKESVLFRLRPEEKERLDQIAGELSGTRTDLITESVYLLIRLWNVYSAECERRNVEPDYAEFGLFLRSVSYDPEPVFGVKR